MTHATPLRPTDIPGMAKGLNYMEKPHRFTPGPGGACLFCSHTQRWHTENRPKTPAEVEQEKKDRAIQDKNQDAYASTLMLTPLPTEQDALNTILSEQKMQTQAAQVAGAPLQDPNDPATASGVTDPKAKAALKKALTEILAERFIKAAEEKPADKDPAPLVNVQYDPDKKAGGISEPERKKLADEGVAMEDGTFPIRDEADLKMALKLWGKATDPHEAREHIIIRAVELGLEDSLPQNIIDHKEASSKKTETDAESDPSRSDSGSTGPVKKAAYAVTKAADESRYTLGPMYIPDRLDAHNEFATADELQKAVWEYTRKGDRSIRLQHNPEIVAGECVEVLSWPQEITSTLSLPTGSLQKAQSVTFPAGTTYMGIVWEPWAWEMVKKGKISGLSMGGFARRTAVTVEGLDLPAPDPDPHTLTLTTDDLKKYSPRQPRDENGRWVGSLANAPRRPAGRLERFLFPQADLDLGVVDDSAPSIDRKSGRAASDAMLNGKPRIPFIPKGTTMNPRTGKETTRYEFDPSRTDTPNSVTREEISALALGLSRLGVNLDMSLGRLLRLHKAATDLSLDPSAFLTAFAKHGQKGKAGYSLLHPGKDGANALYDEDHFSDDEIDAAAAKIRQHDATRPVTDKEYAAHVANLQKILDDYALAGGSKNPLESTNSTHLAHRTDPTDLSSSYTASRATQHAQIISDLIGDALSRGVPAEHKSWIAGGLPGAGKSSFIDDPEGQKKLGLISDGPGKFKNAIVLNPDDIKVQMAARGMMPDIPGTDPLERVGFVHEESSEITTALSKVAMNMGMNVVWDITAHSATSVAEREGELRDFKYDNTTYFMLDVTLEHSLKSAATRHRKGLNRRRSGIDGNGPEEKAEFGGRYVPSFVTLSNSSSSGHRSKMRDAWEEVRTGNAKTKAGRSIGKPYRMILVDNEDYKKQVLDDIIREAK